MKNKDEGFKPAPPKKGQNTTRLAMECQGKAECRGKEMQVCLRFEKEGKCEWAPKGMKAEEEGPGECDGPAECSGKSMAMCKQMQKQSGKCKWKKLTEADMIPGECAGKRGQAECDDKDKATCKQLQRERKCAWVPAPSERKTPTGKCLGPGECARKPRRTCHRMHKQEGKCKWKPAPENEVKVKMTLKNVKLSKMDAKTKEDLKENLEKKIADKAGVDDTAVEVTLSEGSVKIDAVIDMEEKIGLMEAANEGKEVDLVSEMKAMKSEVQGEVGSSAATQELLVTATETEGVKDAADGEIEATAAETFVTAEAATKAPTVEEEVSDASPGEVATTTAGPDHHVVAAAVHQNAFVSLVIVSMAAAMLQ